MGFSGAQVWDAVRAGELAAVRNYCEWDVLNTYLVLLRFELFRGQLQESSYRHELARLRELLAAAPEAHLRQFLADWEREA